MKNYSKKIYVIGYVDEESGEVSDFVVYLNLKDAAEAQEDDTEIAVYELVKTGIVVNTTKVVFG